VTVIQASASKYENCVLLGIMQRVVVILYGRFRTIGTLQGSVRNYHYSLRNNPKERSSQKSGETGSENSNADKTVCQTGLCFGPETTMPDDGRTS